MENVHLTGAKIWLAYLQSGTHSYESYITYLYDELRESRSTLADLGISETDIEEYRALGCKKAAEMWLAYLRSGTPAYESAMHYLRHELSKSGFALADIGTDEDELEECWSRGAKAAARKCLSCLRSERDDARSTLRHLRRELRKGGLSLSDIGTDEDELKELAGSHR